MSVSFFLKGTLPYSFPVKLHSEINIGMINTPIAYVWEVFLSFKNK